MKNKVVKVGVIGAIIASLGFLAYVLTKKKTY